MRAVVGQGDLGVEEHVVYVLGKAELTAIVLQEGLQDLAIPREGPQRHLCRAEGVRRVLLGHRGLGVGVATSGRVHHVDLE